MSRIDVLDRLNEAQRQAAIYGLDQSPPPPLLVIAGAGTGKTTTLAHRVAQLIIKGTRPSRILLLTFTRRATQEMARRVTQICGEALELGLETSQFEWAGTFHAAAVKLLRLHAEQIRLDPGFTVLDRSDSADLMDIVRDELRLARTDRRFPRKATCLAIHSFAINAGYGLDKILEHHFPWCQEWHGELRRLFHGYAQSKARQGLLDYDDLLLYWAEMMRVPQLAAGVGRRFDHILVDEYQDTNPLQASILLGLRPEGYGVTVVGDDAQSIYGFRAASVRNILDFPKSFRPPAHIIPLERNYRSVQSILDLANAVIERRPEGFEKRLWSERISQELPVLTAVDDEQEQAERVAQGVLANREEGMRLRDQAVLFRAAWHSALLELELARRNIPFVKFGGLKFLEAAHVKDLLAILRWAENPKDRLAGYRTLQLLPGVGPATARRACDAVDAAGGSLAALDRCKRPASAARSWPQLAGLLASLAASKEWPGQIEQVRQFYDELLPELHDNAPSRMADLDQLQQIAGGQPSRARFLEALALDPPDGSGDLAGVPVLDEDYLILSTIHSAKGQEWRAVFVLRAVDGSIPSDLATGSSEEIEEERRLFYVALTRAKDRLELMVPRRFYSRGPGGIAHAIRTRFLPDETLPLLTRRGASAAAEPELAEEPEAWTGPAVDIGAIIGNRWRQ